MAEVEQLSFVNGVSVTAPSSTVVVVNPFTGQFTVQTTADNKIILDDDGGGADDVALQTNGATGKFIIENADTSTNLFEIDIAGTAEAKFPAGVSFLQTGNGSDPVAYHRDWTAFTPTLTGSGGAFSSVTYVTQQGEYLRLGTLVFFKLRVDWSAASGGTGGVRVTGLPSSDAQAGGNQNEQMSIRHASINLPGSGALGLVGQMDSGSNGIDIVQVRNNAGVSVLPVADATTGSFNKQLKISGFYEV